MARQSAAFARGFATVLRAGTPPRATAIMSPEELEALLVGDAGLDFAVLEAGAEYVPPLHGDAPLARRFWAAAQALAEDDKRRLLAFVTGSDRVPVGGLRQLPLARCTCSATATATRGCPRRTRASTRSCCPSTPQRRRCGSASASRSQTTRGSDCADPPSSLPSFHANANCATGAEYVLRAMPPATAAPRPERPEPWP